MLAHRADGWVCGLGEVDDSLVFGSVRGAGAFAVVLPSFALLSRMPFAQLNHGFGQGVSGATIVSGSCACQSHLWISRVLTSSSSLGISSLFCRATQCM